MVERKLLLAPQTLAPLQVVFTEWVSCKGAAQLDFLVKSTDADDPTSVDIELTKDFITPVGPTAVEGVKCFSSGVVSGLEANGGVLYLVCPDQTAFPGTTCLTAMAARLKIVGNAVGDLNGVQIESFGHFPWR